MLSVLNIVIEIGIEELKSLLKTENYTGLIIICNPPEASIYNLGRNSETTLQFWDNTEIKATP